MESPFAELLACMAAFGRALEEKFDPQRFLADFCARAQRIVPHDRAVIDYLADDGRSFTVFAEHAGSGRAVFQGRYTTDFQPDGRYAVDDWDLGPVFAGGALLVDDVQRDPHMRDKPIARARLIEAGVRSRIAVPMYADGRVIGLFAVSSFTPGVYTSDHVQACRQIADLIGPFVQSVVLLQHERHRRARLQAITALAPILGTSLRVGDFLERLGEALRSVLDFDAIAIRVVNGDRRSLELVGVLDAEEGARYAGVAAPEEYSTSSRIARGETVVIHDATRELDRNRPGDRRILERGRRSLLIVPLMFGGRVEGYVYFARRLPDFYGEADVEVAEALAAQIVIAIQHQRLAEEQRRAGAAEARAQHLQARVESLRTALADRYDLAHIVGASPLFLDVLDQVRKVAPTETTVLLTGESGTGKEIVARAIHQASTRKDGPFIAINCAALPETLIESELFGHERGAFTGADRLQRGRFELADGGTLFLDEIGELVPALQAKLLRVLQERQFERVGGTTLIDADVRVITATNRDLEQAVAQGRFRDDLYYRLAVFGVHLPPLRERGDDVVLLAEHFLCELSAKTGKAVPGLCESARGVLRTHRWPGNIRELQNAVERALIVSDGGPITAEQLGVTVRRHAVEPAAPAATSTPALPAPAPRAESLADVERRTIIDALERAHGNKSRAAAALGITRTQLYGRLKRFGLDA
jgi:transcriptional regulator with GAF, ATPase, and Fis domain